MEAMHIDFLPFPEKQSPSRRLSALEYTLQGLHLTDPTCSLKHCFKW